MAVTAARCDLCGNSIEGEPVVRHIDGGEQHFCCAGCARTYEKAHSEGMGSRVVPGAVESQPKLAARVLEGGDTAYFALGGMYCAGCAAAAERVLRSRPGIKDADVSFAAERGRLRYDPEVVDLTEALSDLDRLGYQARILGDPSQRSAERKQEHTLLQLIVAAAFGMQVMLLYLVQLYPRYAAQEFDVPEVRRLQYLVWLLATPVLLIGGSSILRGAWRALRARTATMDTLVALGTLAAYGYSVYVAIVGGGEAYFDSVAMIITFIMVGRYLETLGGARARKDIQHLLKLQPDTAHRLADEKWTDVPSNSLVAGDTILVRPGERVPADARVVEGQAALDEALLTGESEPVNKGPEDVLYAGAIVTDAAMRAQVIDPPGETRLAQITQLVERTLTSKPPIQRLADKASAYFAVGILAIAVLTAIGWWWAGRTATQALLAAVAVLVVACPCALGLATPLALTVTLGRTTRVGVLVRNPKALELAAKIDRMVFDKTGTLTQGKMAIVATKPASGFQEREVLRAAAGVEQFSEHPLARAIVNAWGESPPAASDFSLERGMGASAEVVDQGGGRVRVGSSDYVVGDGAELPIEGAQEHAERGESLVWVGWSGQVTGFLAVRDEPNPTARAAIAQLRQESILPVLLSGDNLTTTAAIAAEVGLEDFEGSCLPSEKATKIASWQQAGEKVGMVGDGVNDAPALAQADLSITVAGGTDVAGETSDIVLTRHDLTLVPWLIARSRRTRQIILENLGWAFAYNLLAVPLAAFGVISPVIAAGAMATSSLLVVGNSLRLRR